jgi:hypothetical protein
MLNSIFKVTPWARNLVCLAVVMGIPCCGGISKAQQLGGTSGIPQRDITTWPPINPLANRTADANRIMEDSMKVRENQKRLEQLNLQRQKEMTSDTEKLLSLANQLKAATDKNSKDLLSMESVREAEEIEKLAHSVRQKMKAAVSN